MYFSTHKQHRDENILVTTHVRGRTYGPTQKHYGHRALVVGQVEIASNFGTGGLDWELGKNSALKGLSSTGTDCPEKWQSHHPWRYLKHM